MLPVFIVWIAFDMHTDGYHSYMCAKNICSSYYSLILKRSSTLLRFSIADTLKVHLEYSLLCKSLHSLHVNILVTAFYAWFVCISLPDLHIQMCTCNYVRCTVRGYVYAHDESSEWWRRRGTPAWACDQLHLASHYIWPVIVGYKWPNLLLTL